MTWESWKNEEKVGGESVRMIILVDENLILKKRIVQCLPPVASWQERSFSVGSSRPNESPDAWSTNPLMNWRYLVLTYPGYPSYLRRLPGGFSTLFAQRRNQLLFSLGGGPKQRIFRCDHVRSHCLRTFLSDLCKSHCGGRSPWHPGQLCPHAFACHVHAW